MEETLTVTRLGITGKLKLTLQSKEVVFDRGRDVREAAIAGDFAEPGFGFEHPGGGPSQAHLA